MRKIKEIINPQEDVEYILVSDVDYKSDTWTVVVDERLKSLPIWERCWSVRYKVFDYINTDICFYMDANHAINDGAYLTKYVDIFVANNFDFSTTIHPERFLMSEEINAWKNRCREERGTPDSYFVPLDRWAANYDDSFKGQYQTNVMILRRDRNDVCTDVYNLMKEWKEELGLDDFYRIEQPVFSGLLNTKYLNWNILPLSQYVAMNCKLCRCDHNTNRCSNTHFTWAYTGFFKNQYIRPFYID